MKMVRLAVVMSTLAIAHSPAGAQNAPAPKQEDAEKNAFQTPTAGKQAPSERSGQTQSSANPESRLNDEAPAKEKNGTSDTPGK